MPCSLHLREKYSSLYQELHFQFASLRSNDVVSIGRFEKENAKQLRNLPLSKLADTIEGCMNMCEKHQHKRQWGKLCKICLIGRLIIRFEKDGHKCTCMEPQVQFTENGTNKMAHVCKRATKNGIQIKKRRGYVRESANESLLLNENQLKLLEFEESKSLEEELIKQNEQLANEHQFDEIKFVKNDFQQTIQNWRKDERFEKLLFLKNLVSSAIADFNIKIQEKYCHKKKNEENEENKENKTRLSKSATCKRRTNEKERQSIKMEYANNECASPQTKRRRVTISKSSDPPSKDHSHFDIKEKENRCKSQNGKKVKKRCKSANGKKNGSKTYHIHNNYNIHLTITNSNSFNTKTNSDNTHCKFHSDNQNASIKLGSIVSHGQGNISVGHKDFDDKKNDLKQESSNNTNVKYLQIPNQIIKEFDEDMAILMQ